MDGGYVLVAFLVTGSARLDHYRKGGDSLQGCYHHYRLHPFSLCEIATSHRRATWTRCCDLADSRSRF